MILRLLYRTVLALTYLVLITPMAVIVTVAFGSSAVFQFPPPGLTLHWFSVFFASSDMITALARVSLPIAVATSVLALALGVPASIACVRYRFPGRDLIFSVLNLPLMIPQVLLAVAILLLMIVMGMRPSMLWLMLGHTLITLPFVVNTMMASLARVDPSLEEAAMNLGSTRVGALFRIVVPLIRSGFLAGGLLAFIISFADSNIALFLSGPGVVTLPIYIFSSLTFEAEPDIAAASAVQIGVVAVLLVVLAKVSGLGRQYGR